MEHVTTNKDFNSTPEKNDFDRPYEPAKEVKRRSKSGEKKNILVVEDSAIQVELYKIAFEHYSCDFFYANDGMEALKMITDGPKMSLIVSDLNLPNMNGIELLRTINEKKLTDCPFVIVSTGENITDLEKAVELGAACYVIKPWNMDQITDILDALEKK